jgi:hypothetical protein
MRRWHRSLIILMMSSITVVLWCYFRVFQPTVLAFHLGQTFEQVAANSTYPVIAHANRPADAPGDHKFGAIWVTAPAVIIRFTDPEHGFTLPATKFAALTFSENKAVTLATSPMLDPLPFDEAVTVLENLQNQFKAGGWEPWTRNDSTWFDLTPEGKKRLYERMFEPGYYMQTAVLRIPGKYGLTFRLECNEGCWTKEPPYRFLIDIGLSEDVFGWQPDDAVAREPSSAIVAHGVQK